ncbi:MAG: cell division protein FtsA [Blastochloris sp.]|nr:cell division protein FtsA [Blastochloris sp.]
MDYYLAQQSIEDVILEAEKKIDGEIGEVFIALTGSHIDSRTVRVKTTIENEELLVSHESLEELRELAQGTVLPADQMVVHELLQHYYLDNGQATTQPLGSSSQSLEASYHIIHGMQTRLETSARCVAELGVAVQGCALASYATAQAVLTQEYKELGSVVIDLGAGVTDYIVYYNGAVVHTGVIAVGGDHMTQDIALGLKLSFNRAEQLKSKHGLLYHQLQSGQETVLLERSLNEDERTIYLQSLAQIMMARQKETLDLIREDLERNDLWPSISGKVFLTGGASKVRGLQRLASQVFPAPVQIAHELTFEGDQTYSKRPDLSTVLGLLRYAQHVRLAAPRPKGWRKVKESFRDLLGAVRLF